MTDILSDLVKADGDTIRSTVKSMPLDRLLAAAEAQTLDGFGAVVSYSR